MKRKFYWLVSSSLAITMVSTMVGCGAVKTRDVRTSDLSQIRNAAVVSFSVVQPPGAMMGLSVGASDDSLPGGAQAGSLIPAQNEDITAMHEELSNALAKDMRWKMKSAAEMKANGPYQKAYAAKMKGWQSKRPVQGQLYIVPEIMDAQSLSRMKPTERDELIQGLGVDAIAEAQVDITLAHKGMVIAGIGSRYPQARVSLWVYKKGVEAPIWYESAVEGEPAKSSVGKTNVYDDAEVSKFGRESARTAFAKLAEAARTPVPQ